MIIVERVCKEPSQALRNILSVSARFLGIFALASCSAILSGRGAVTSSLNLTFGAFSPVSPSNDGSPSIVGTVDESATSVNFYSDSNCSLLVGSGTPSGFNGAGIALTVLQNTTTSIYGQAVVGPDDELTDCVLLSSYLHDDVAPASPASISPADGAQFADATPTISGAAGSAEAGATLDIVVTGDDTGSCSTTVTGDGSWSCTLAALDDSGASLDLVFTVKQTDLAGNESTTTVLNYTLLTNNLLGGWFDTLPMVFQASRTNRSTAATAPMVDVNESGQAVVVWSQSDGVHSRIFVSERSSLGVWTHPASFADAISVRDVGDASWPAVKINSSGLAIVTWSQQVGEYAFASPSPQIFMSERAADGTWSHPSGMDDYISHGKHGYGSSNPIQIELNNSGQALLVWVHGSAYSSFALYKSERAADGTWTHPQDPNDYFFESYFGSSPTGVNAQMNSSGEAVVAWYSGSTDTGSAQHLFKSERAADGTWTHPASRGDYISLTGSSASGFTSGKPQVAINDDGEALIAYHRMEGVGGAGQYQQLYISSRSGDGTWTHPATYDDHVSTGAFSVSDVKVSLNADGEAIVVWKQNSIIKSLARDGDNTWGAIVDLVTTNNPGGPSIELNDSSQAVLAWRRGSGTNYIYYMERSALGVWGTEQLASSAAAAAAPAIKLTNAGHVLMTWTQTDGVANQVFYSQRATNGTWAHPSGVSDNISPSTQYATRPRVGVSDDGQAVVAWLQSDGTYTQLYKSSLSTTGVWTHPSSLSDTVSFATSDVSSVELRMNASGQALLVWAQGDIYVAERSAAGVWELPSDANDNITPASGSAAFDLDLNDAGAAIVVWAQTRMFKAERSTLGVWQIPADSNDYFSSSVQSANSPEVDMNASGQVVVIWHQSNGTHQQIYKSERTALGVWTHPADLNDTLSYPGIYCGRGDVSLNNAGEAIVVWSYTNRLAKAERDSSGTWTRPVDLNDIVSHVGTASANTNNAEVKIGENGEAVIVWVQGDGDHYNGFYGSYYGFYRIYISERAANGVWTIPSSSVDAISEPGAHVAIPQLEMNDDGDVFVVWRGGANATDLYRYERLNGVWDSEPTAFGLNRPVQDFFLSRHVSGDTLNPWIVYSTTINSTLDSGVNILKK